MASLMNLFPWEKCLLKFSQGTSIAWITLYLISYGTFQIGKNSSKTVTKPEIQIKFESLNKEYLLMESKDLGRQELKVRE